VVDRARFKGIIDYCSKVQRMMCCAALIRARERELDPSQASSVHEWGENEEQEQARKSEREKDCVSGCWKASFNSVMSHRSRWIHSIFFRLGLRACVRAKVGWLKGSKGEGGGRRRQARASEQHTVSYVCIRSNPMANPNPDTSVPAERGVPRH